MPEGIATADRGELLEISGLPFARRKRGHATTDRQDGEIGEHAGATDFVIIVMNDGGTKSWLKSKVKLGADANVAAGLVGRTSEASTNERMQAQMLSYSRSRGLFGGVSLSGPTLRPDGSANEKLYGKKVTPGQIMAGAVVMPPEAAVLISELKRTQTGQARATEARFRTAE